MDANNFLLFQASQSKKTTLDKAYKKHMVNILNSFDEEEESKWETYSMIVNSLSKVKNENILQEIKYRLTDEENINDILLSIIDRHVLEVDGLVWFLKKRLEDYLEDEFLKKFYL